MFIDDYTCYTIIYLLRQKSEAFEKFKQYKQMVENQKNKTIKVLRANNGGEYKSLEFTKFCEKYRILRQFTVPYTPQQNGVAERRNRTLVEAVITMLNDAKLPKVFWGEAVMIATYIQNQVPTIAIDSYKPPFEL